MAKTNINVGAHVYSSIQTREAVQPFTHEKLMSKKAMGRYGCTCFASLEKSIPHFALEPSVK